MITHTSFPKQEFIETQRKNPYWSSFTCFAETVRGRNNLHKRTLRRYFNNLVEVDDYAKKDKAEILNFLFDSARPKTISPHA